MALQSSGQISLQDIANEFGGSTPHAISEYYRNGGLVPGNNTSVPTSGTIDFADFYGTTAATSRTLSNGATNVNLSQTFGTDWASSISKILIIPSGAEIGATGSTSNRAITVPSGMGGTLSIQNAGTISGAGGTGGTSSGSNGAQGGSALLIVSANVTVQNSGTIRGGGGGGAAGNDGSPGSTGYQEGPYYWQLQCNGGSGGGHGDGGNGQGYGSSATNGATGSPGGGISATGNLQGPEQQYCDIFNPHHGLSQTPGSPGTPGGAGGTFGNTGTSVSPGGSGGPAGKYIELSGVSYTLQNSGSLQGSAP